MVLVAKTPGVFPVTHLFGETMHNLGNVNQIPLGEGRRFGISGRAIAVFRGRQGGLFATQSACTHRAGPLVDGLIGGDTLVCPPRDFKFNLETGEPLDNDCPALRTYPIWCNAAGAILVGYASPSLLRPL